MCMLYDLYVMKDDGHIDANRCIGRVTHFARIFFETHRVSIKQICSGRTHRTVSKLFHI